MSAGGDILYLKIERNIAVSSRHVTLGDISKMYCGNKSALRQLKQQKIYSFPENKKKKEQIQVFSVMKLIEQIQQAYPSLTIENMGETDFVLEYRSGGQPAKWKEVVKAVFLCIIIFFGGAFTIMAFNNDISITDLFGKLYEQVLGERPEGITELEICYSIGLAIGVLMFFNHIGRKKITADPTPVQVQMRKYEQDVDDTFIENAGRGGKSIDVD